MAVIKQQIFAPAAVKNIWLALLFRSIKPLLLDCPVVKL